MCSFLNSHSISFCVILLFLTNIADADVACGQVKIKNPSALISNATPSYHGQWPWLAILFTSEDRYVCGSSIITRWHLLSAAHCVIAKTEDFHAILGRFNLSDSSELDWRRRNMRNIYVHPDFTKTDVQMSNGDIAIFEVSEEIQFSNFIQPICLPEVTASVIDISGAVAGYGVAQAIHDQHQKTPSFTMLNSIDKWVCLRKGHKYVEVVSERSFCAGNTNSIPCKGDSGGGFYVYDKSKQQYSIYGVVSHAIGICDPREYVVFTDLPKFIPWIHEKISASKLCGSGYAECNGVLRNSLISDNMINAFAIKMRNNDCEELRDFARDHTSDREYQEKIVRAAYANNVNNAENILKCISSMPFMQDDITSLPVLYQEMKRNYHLDTPQLMILALKVKAVMEMENYPNMSQYFRDKIVALMNNLPDTVRDIIWNGNRCTVKNYYREEYLYATDYTYDSDRRRVFTWVPGNTVFQGDWKFEPEDGGNHFIMKNLHYNEYFYAAGGGQKYDRERRNVFTWIPGSAVTQGRWILVPQRSATLFKLKNRIHKEYLYSAGNKYNEDRRMVFTHDSGDSDGDNFLWEISCK